MGAVLVAHSGLDHGGLAAPQRLVDGLSGVRHDGAVRFLLGEEVGTAAVSHDLMAEESGDALRPVVPEQDLLGAVHDAQAGLQALEDSAQHLR